MCLRPLRDAHCGIFSRQVFCLHVSVSCSFGDACNDLHSIFRQWPLNILVWSCREVLTGAWAYIPVKLRCFRYVSTGIVCLSVNCCLWTDFTMALIIYVCVYCLGVVMSSLCISSAMHSYLFPLQRALSLALSAFKEELVRTCDHARMCTVEPMCLCITCK